MEEEIVWLIEQEEQGNYLSELTYQEFIYSNNPHMAIKIKDKEDAERIIKIFGLPDMVTEHLFYRSTGLS